MGQADVRHLKVRGVGIAIQDERIVPCSQAAAELARRDVSGAVAVRRGRDDIRRQRPAVAVALGQPAYQRAEAGIIRAAWIDQGAVDPVRPAHDRPVHAGVMLRLPVVHRTDDGELVGVPGQMRQ